jgi:dienelactone hydrolase
MTSVCVVTSRVTLFLGCIGITQPLLSCASSPQASTPQSDAADPEAPSEEPWIKRRARGTTLKTKGPSFESAPPLNLSGTGLTPISYTSGDLRLFAALAVPGKTPETPDTPTERMPAVMLLHSGFVMRQYHLEWAQRFVDAGFVVMMPTVRGENGNPGSYELWFGEVDDVKSATRWLASQPEVDVDRMYLFGHSAGGALATLIALDENMPYRIIATSNGVYASATFGRWFHDEPKRIPFDVNDMFERQLRAIVPNAHELARPILIYAGTDDEWTQKHAAMVKQRAPDRVEIVQVKGDHMASTLGALDDFLKRVMKDAEERNRAAPRHVARK